jgi:hypothetical protein
LFANCLGRVLELEVEEPGKTKDCEDDDEAVVSLDVDLRDSRMRRGGNECTLTDLVEFRELEMTESGKTKDIEEDEVVESLDIDLRDG